MSVGRDSLIVGVIVLVAVVWAVRSVWRSVRRGKACSSCAAGDDCPLTRSGKLQEPQELQNLPNFPERNIKG